MKHLLIIALLGGGLLAQGCKRRSSTSDGGASSPRGSGFTIRSANEPKSDTAALALVGITMTPAPDVEYRRFTAGMDDHMDLVIRFPKSRLPEFWTESKWDEMDSKSLKDIEPQWRTHWESKVKRIGGSASDPILESIRKSADGIFCDDQQWHNGGLKVFLSLDQDPDDVVAYIEWFEV
ncbi:MAG: hypothetical protein H7A50_13165 [Akkermansiaceae bacterium]|nr:hypothetical protein [Akkermansiaceae bacterium]